jgi:predicted component of type VI protein secretion system
MTLPGEFDPPKVTMDVRLIVENGAAKKQAIRLRRASTIIGRQKGCDLRIPSSGVSRRHSRLTVRDDCLVIEDLGSANGTYVNGARAEGKQLVRPGDLIEVGLVTFRVEYALTRTAIDRLLQAVESGEFASHIDETHADREPALIDVEVVDDDITDENLAAVEVIEEEPIGPEDTPINFDSEDAWRLPASADLRDILAKMGAGDKEN